FFFFSFFSSFSFSSSKSKSGATEGRRAELTTPLESGSDFSDSSFWAKANFPEANSKIRKTRNLLFMKEKRQSCQTIFSKNNISFDFKGNGISRMPNQSCYCAEMAFRMILHIKYSVLFRIYNLLPIFEEFVINLLKK